MLDALVAVQAGDLVAINLQMRPDHYDEKRKEIQVFGPSLLSFCTVNRAYIIDLHALASEQLDQKLCWLIQNLPLTFCAFSAPCLINYFREFLPEFQFLRYVPNLMDVKIGYSRVKSTPGKNFSMVHYLLFGQRYSPVVTNWDKRPLHDNQIKTAALEAQVLLRMAYKIRFMASYGIEGHARMFPPQICYSVHDYALQMGYKQHYMRKK